MCKRGPWKIKTNELEEINRAKKLEQQDLECVVVTQLKTFIIRHTCRRDSVRGAVIQPDRRKGNAVSDEEHDGPVNHGLIIMNTMPRMKLIMSIYSRT